MIRRLPQIAVLAVPFTVLVLGCQNESWNVFFTDVTDDAGIDFSYTFGDSTYETALSRSSWTLQWIGI